MVTNQQEITTPANTGVNQPTTAWKKWSVFCRAIATLLAKTADFNGVRLTRAELTTAESISAAVPPWDQRLQFSR